VLALVALAIVTFALGRVTGGGTPPEVAAGRPEELPGVTTPATVEDRRAALPPAVPSEPEPTAPSQAEALPPPSYAVQVASYDPGKVNLAEDLATFLRSKGFPDVAVLQQADGKFRVCAGRFPSKDDPVANQYLQAIKRLHYPNSDFTSAYVVKLPQ